MAKPPLVSVVLPTYNMARFVPGALQSVLSQTYRHLEVHVVDDGSADDPRNAIAPLLSDDRVHFHWQPHAGQGRARNTGVRLARGDYVAFLDADDLWVPDKLERQLPLFDRPDVGVVYTDFQCIDVKGAQIPTSRLRARTGRITNELLIENFVTGMTSLVRRECFESVGPFDELLPMGNDYDLFLRISTKFEFAYLDHVTYLYRHWEGQLSRNFEARLDCAIAIMKRLLDAHPGLIPRDIENTAWAHTYTSGGHAFATAGRRKTALSWYLKALRARPGYLPAWVRLLRLALP
jgi:glycosyltransferase involved in cell wall biosynthesis